MNAHDEIQKARELKAWLLAQGEDDPQLIADTLEGETSLKELLDWAIRKYLDEEEFAAAIKSRAYALGGRKKSAEARAEKMRFLIQDIMTVTGEKTYRGVEATVTLKAVAPKPTVTDESLIPERFFRIEKILDKAKVNAEFANEPIPGVVLGNGGQTLSIRTK